MLSRAGRTVIMDFGIARSQRSTQKDRAVSGTPAYMSPEQMNGGPIDGRSDLYSLGVMMFEMLVGQLPFSGATPMEMALARQLHDAPLLSTVRPDIPREAVQLVARCLARQPQERFATAEDLRRALLCVPLTVDQLLVSGQPKPNLDTDLTVVLNTETRLRTVAVWRLQNQGGPDQSYLAEGIADSLGDAIACVRDVRVIQRAAMEKQAKQTAVPLEAAKKLGAHTFLCGSFSLQKQILSLTLRLIAVDSGFQIWAERWEVPLGQAIELCQRAATAIAGALTTDMLSPQTEGKLDPETLSLYLKARQLYTGNDPAYFQHSVELLEQALAREPSSPILLVGYAKACARAWFWGQQEDGDKSMAAAERAVEVAPSQGAPYAALGAARYGTGDLPGAVRALRKGLSLAPQLGDLHELLGRILCECGPLSEAVARLESAIRLEPLHIRPRLEMIRMFALTGAWKQVDSMIDQELIDPHAVPMWWMVTGRMALWRRDPAWAKKKLELPGDESLGCKRGKRLLLAASRDDGSGALSEEEWKIYFGTDARTSPRRRVVLRQGQTELRCYHNEREQGLLALQLSVSDGLCDIMWMDLCPLLALLRGDPRFQALRQEVAARAAKIRDAMDATLI